MVKSITKQIADQSAQTVTRKAPTDRYLICLPKTQSSVLRAESNRLGITRAELVRRIIGDWAEGVER